MGEVGKSPQRWLDEEMMNAWRQAARDLEIRVIIPFVLITEDGERESYEAHVMDFGGPSGTIVGGIHDDKNSSDRRKEAGYDASDLAPVYRSYDRQLFIDTLDDWKWFGAEGKQPAWYTGKNWS